MMDPGKGIPWQWQKGKDGWKVKAISIITVHGPNPPIVSAHLDFKEMSIDYAKRVVNIYNREGLLMTFIPFENIAEMTPIWTKGE